MESFARAYENLNSAQKKAVDTIEGPVMVVAGPGTGKTQILTLRIANILAKTDTKPEQILALTFTEAAAYNMTRRLTELIGNAAYRVVVSTFHGFCNDIIKRYPEDFPRIIGSKSISEVDQVSTIESLIEAGDFVLLKPFGDRFLYVRDIVHAIGELKREGVSPERFSSLVIEEKNAFEKMKDLYHEKGPHAGKMKGQYQRLQRKILKNEELSKMYEQYQAKLFALKQYDFNDMILEVLGALLQNETLLQILQEEHQYILVDEHQDTNNAQNRIVQLIMSYHRNPNIFVVGDEKQAIYRFQGASIENFQYFKKLYPTATLVTLTDNYRSTQRILNTAHRLIPTDTLLQKNTSHAETPIVIAQCATAASERYIVATKIERMLRDGVPPGEIAVLYRNNKDAFLISRALTAKGVPHTIESDQDLFSHRDVSRFLILLRGIATYGDDVHLTPLLHLTFFGIDPLDAYKVLRYSAQTKTSLYDALLKNSGEIPGVHCMDSIAELGSKLKEWVRESRAKKLDEFFEYLLRDCGLLDEILASGIVDDRFDALRTLFDETKKLLEINASATLADFFAYIETVRKHNLFLKRKNQQPKKGTVRLMTVHRSKGLEFDHVFIINAVEGVFGGKIDRDRLPLIDSVYMAQEHSAHRSDNSFAEGGLSDEDERRLFYVALTRAKQGVTITYALEDDQRRNTLPSSFIEAIRSELVEYGDVGELEAEFRQNPLTAHTHVPSESTPSTTNREFVADLFFRQGFSPTALNNYLECPWKYFYQNLIRIPTTQTIHQHYGTAVHAALQDFFKRMIAEESTKEFLIESFKGHLHRLPLSPRDIQNLLMKGEKALSGWYDAYAGSWNAKVTSEFEIKGIEIDGVKLTGVLDKIEYHAGKAVEVVDYKTARPKTRNEIMGKTKGADGNYYRQLVFYKLLLKHFADGKFSMQSGTIDFIEPDEKGRYHKETFEIHDDEVVELAETIKRVAEEITQLSFWERICANKDCEYCALRNLSHPLNV